MIVTCGNRVVKRTARKSLPFWCPVYAFCLCEYVRAWDYVWFPFFSLLYFPWIWYRLPFLCDTYFNWVTFIFDACGFRFLTAPHTNNISGGHQLHLHLSLNRGGGWGTATSFLKFSLFSTALWDLANSRPVHSLLLSSHLFLYLPCLLPLSLCLARWIWPDLINGRLDHTTAVCVSSRWSGGVGVVRLPAESWHGLPRW